MTHLKRSTILIILLAACGSTPSSVTPTATTSALTKGEFVGDVDNLASIRLSTNGQQVIAYLTCYFTVMTTFPFLCPSST